MNPLLQLEGISRSFGGVPVLKQVTLNLETGRTLGLVGENGAGKSTLMNLLGGNLRPDAGRMKFAGRAYAPARPADAAATGIAFVHQELNLFPNLSIAENLFLTRFPTRATGWIRRAELRAATAARLQEVGLHLPPETPVERLSAGERQLVEIAKALGIQPRLLILDEPTTSLSDRETRQLFTLLDALRARGLTMIYISHTLEHVLHLSDQVAVLRDGELVGHGPRAGFDAPRLISLMVGRELKQLFPPRRAAAVGGARNLPAPPGNLPGDNGISTARTETTARSPNSLPLSSGESPDGTGRWPVPPTALFEVRGLSQPGVLRNINLTLRAGEVAGVFGLMGAGRSELARVLFGLDPCAQGDIRLGGVPLEQMPPAQRIRHGLAFLTEDRRAEGLALEASIADNLALVTLPHLARSVTGWLDARALRGMITRIREAVRLTASAHDNAPVKTLSGGNQQKVVLAKWLLAHPRVLLLDEPTRGIDVGAKFEIYQLIQRLADDGAGVLFISSELEELIGICDRVLVMRRGELVEDLSRPDFDRERILRSALHEGNAP